MDKLGIQLPVLLTQLVNFGILLVVLNKFLYKPILNGLAARKQKIEDGLKAAKDSEAEKGKLEKRKQDLLKEAREEAAVIISNAKKDAKKEQEKILKVGRDEAVAYKAKLEKELKVKYDRMAQELSEQTVDVATKMVEKLLGSIVSDADHQKIIDAQMKKLKNQYGA